MNRRTLLSKLASLPFIGFLFRPAVAAPVAQIVKAVPMQQASWCSALFCLHDMRKGNDALMNIADEIEHGVNTFIRQCNAEGVPLESVSIRWTNIPDPETNPNGTVGKFLIVGTRGNSIYFGQKPVSNVSYKAWVQDEESEEKP